ncbi:MAG: oxidoreductase [Chitinophagaceae bacterium]
MIKLVCFVLLISWYDSLTAQKITLLNTNKGVSFRGLSVVTDKIIWASGSKGTVARSTDSGNTWSWISIPGFEKRDFRDIEAFDAVTAIVMAIDTPGTILKTVDGGLHWKTVYENKTPGMFLDAMEFWNDQSGIVIGDPINGKFFIARTFDNGNSWHQTSATKLPAADSGEACFASSGTNIRALNLAEACFISGGLRSRFFWKGTPVDLPLLQGSGSSGANSIAVRNNKTRKNNQYIVVVGGDFSRDTAREKNCVLSSDGGKNWRPPATPPHGYRSCVEFITKTKMITCGTSGIDVSTDAGMNWELISTESFHVCRKAKKGKAVFLAGNGKIAKLNWR